ncbi:ATP-binding protein [Streptomyces sp. M-16]|uniref:ATP-binding protein n=1 Tax=Streptomyces sp. M-16 TaxID=3233040 RepID=UPI003F9AE860
MAAHHQLTFTVARTAVAAQQARHHVIAGIRSWGIRLGAEALDEIELAAGELITNAVCHTASGPITVNACQEGPVLVVEVHDAAKVLPRPEPLERERRVWPWPVSRIRPGQPARCRSDGHGQALLGGVRSAPERR